MANPYVKQVWADDDPTKPPSAARFGVMEQGIFDAHFAPAVRAFHGGAQAVLTSTDTILAFDNERFDTHGMHSGSVNNSRLTCQVAGKYQITANIAWSASPAGGRIQLFFNLGAIIASSHALTADTRVMHISTLYDMAVNDFVEVRVFQASGGTINVNVAANYSPEFMAVRVA